MGASASTAFENDIIEASVAKLFENNVHLEASSTSSSEQCTLTTTALPPEYLAVSIDTPPEYLTVDLPDDDDDQVQLNSDQDHHQDNKYPDDDDDQVQLNSDQDHHQDNKYPENLTGDSPKAPEVHLRVYNYNSMEKSERDLRKEYLPLYKAALRGDWRRARKYFEDDPGAMLVGITMFSETALHVAARAGHSMFVEKLVKLMPPEALELAETKDGDTALHLAATVGVTRAAMAMVKKNPKLTQIRNNDKWVPLITAAYYASDEKKEMVKYLCKVTRDEDPSPFKGVSGGTLIGITTASCLYDIALHLVKEFPDLAREKGEAGYYALEMLARRPSAFFSGNTLTSWQRFIYSFIYVEDPQKNTRNILTRGRGPMTKFFSMNYLTQVTGIKQVYKEKLMHKQALALVKCICAQISEMPSSDIIKLFEESDILGTATRYGTVELVVECIQMCPDIIWLRSNNKTILGKAIKYRQEKIFNLICGMNGIEKKFAFLSDQNTIVHLAAKLAPPPQLNSVSGAALQMQRELQWFKEVKNLALQRHKHKKNDQGMMAKDLFTEQHKDLMQKGEDWMKHTAQQCTVVTTLIATVVFAAAFTVPGGNINDSNNSNNGKPIFLNNTSFMVFAIADALSLFSSITSVIILLSILTSRYAEEDFLESLPKKLIIALATLFFSIATMIVAFSAALFIVLGERFAWAPIPIVLIACVPVTLFALLQLPLFVEIVGSTYGSNIFVGHNQRMQWNY